MTADAMLSREFKKLHEELSTSRRERSLPAADHDALGQEIRDAKDAIAGFVHIHWMPLRTNFSFLPPFQSSGGLRSTRLRKGLSAMKNPDLRFEITHKIRIHVDLPQKRVVISCVTKDGKSLHLETSYEAIDQIHREIQKQLDR